MQKSALSLAICVAASGSTACSGGGSSPSISSIPSAGRSFSRLQSGPSPITHIVLIVQENRTFNNLFATFPGATGATRGKKKASGRVESVTLKETNLGGQRNFNHNYKSFLTGYDNGKLDAFNLIKFANNNKNEGNGPYEYVNPSQIQPYWQIAEQYGLANAMFATQGSDSFPAHQDLIRGGTAIDSSDSLIDNPPYSGAWGCDSAPGTKTSLINTYLQVRRGVGPFPCTQDFPGSGANYRTLRDLMDNASVSWKYYTPEIGASGAIWDAFDVISPVRFGSEWGTNVNWPETNIFNDISNGQLANMSWVIPDGVNSDHPNRSGDTGPSWVASIVNAIGESQYWDSTAIIVVWDDWGGFYDPVPPPLPRDNQGGPGLRIPMLVVSPYARIGSGSQGGYISNTVYAFGSIIRFVEDTFNLGRLGTTDGTSNSMDDMFNFYQSPRQYQSIGSKYSRSYFMHQKPSGIPVDTE
ncbi:MAG: alkaline phosphatase family protein [Candidatus Cybelea sp.]